MVLVLMSILKNDWSDKERFAIFLTKILKNSGYEKQIEKIRLFDLFNHTVNTKYLTNSPITNPNEFS